MGVGGRYGGCVERGRVRAGGWVYEGEGEGDDDDDDEKCRQQAVSEQTQTYVGVGGRYGLYGRAAVLGRLGTGGQLLCRRSGRVESTARTNVAAPSAQATCAHVVCSAARDGGKRAAGRSWERPVCKLGGFW